MHGKGEVTIKELPEKWESDTDHRSYLKTDIRTTR